MANEITVTTNLFAAKASAVIGTAAITKQKDMSGGDMAQVTQTITESADVALDIGSVATGGHYWLEIFNRDATNYIDIGDATGGSFAASIFARVPANSSILLHRTGAAYGKANTADVDVSIRAVEA
jgi:hypothetical protein